jgi:hypothetical protein
MQLIFCRVVAPQNFNSRFPTKMRYSISRSRLPEFFDRRIFLLAGNNGRGSFYIEISIDSSPSVSFFSSECQAKKFVRQKKSIFLGC